MATSVISVHHHARSICWVTAYLREVSRPFHVFSIAATTWERRRLRQSLFGCQSHTLALRRALSLPRAGNLGRMWLPHEASLKFQLNLQVERARELESVEISDGVCFCLFCDGVMIDDGWLMRCRKPNPAQITQTGHSAGRHGDGTGSLLWVHFAGIHTSYFRHADPICFGFQGRKAK